MIDRFLRTLPVFRGKQRIARFLLKSKIATSRNLKIDTKFGCTLFVPNIQENIGFELLINGAYEEDTIKFIIDRLKPGSFFLDIGANIGAIGVIVAKMRKDVSVVCLEAAPWIFDFLQRNVIENKVDVTLINKAISDVGGQQVSFFSPEDKFGKGSLAPVFTQQAVNVLTTTLDDIGQYTNGVSIGMIKIDVEGFESLAFKGGAELLGGKDAPDILFEFVDWAEDLSGVRVGSAQQLLFDYGYSMYRFDKSILFSSLATPITRGSSMLFATKKIAK